MSAPLVCVGVFESHDPVSFHVLIVAFKNKVNQWAANQDHCNVKRATATIQSVTTLSHFINDKGWG